MKSKILTIIYLLSTVFILAAFSLFFPQEVKACWDDEDCSEGWTCIGAIPPNTEGDCQQQGCFLGIECPPPCYACSGDICLWNGACDSPTCPDYTDCGTQTCDLCTQVCCISGCRSIADGCGPPPCEPSCSSPYCGQADGCGGTCSTSSIGAGCGSPYCGQLDACGLSCGSSDAGAPGAPTLNPGDGGTVTVAESAEATVSWSAPALADSYQIELYPAGTNCVTSGAYCDLLSGLSYSFLPLYSSYYYRVRALNSTCSTEWGAWTEATFSVRGTISGTVKQDDNKEAVLVGDVCVLAGASGVQPGAGSKVVVGLDSGSVQGDGTYEVSPLFGPSWYTELAIGDATEWRCTCPVGCAYITSAPKSGLDYFVANIKEAWWQAEEGNIHADGGNVRSAVPDTATEPYLITGTQPGLVSYSGSVDINDAEAINQDLSNWQAQTSYQGLKTDYGYFKRILEDDPVEFGDWFGELPVTNGVFLGSGASETSGGDWQVNNGDIYVILVPNDITITNNINVDPGGFLGIISSGNITINNAVTNIEGVYISDGVIDSGTGEIQLTGEGIFTGWQGISLNRDFNSSVNNTTPVEIFIYRPDLVRNAYRYLLKPKISWQEVIP